MAVKQKRKDKRKKKFGFREGSRLPQSKAQSVGEYLDKLRAKNPNLSSVDWPELIWKDACENRSAPTREFFEWDKSKAWNAHNLERARHLVRSITIRYVDVDKGTNEGPLPCYVSYVEERQETTHRPIDYTLSDEARRREYGIDLLHRCEGQIDAYRDYYPEFAPVFAAIEKCIESLK